MPIIQRPYVPPEDQVPQEDQYVNPGDTQQADGYSGEAITFYCDSMHIFSSLYSAVLFFGEQLEEREPILRARIKVSPQMLKAISLLTTKHVKEYEEAVGNLVAQEELIESASTKPEYDTKFYRTPHPHSLDNIFQSLKDWAALKSVLQTWSESTTGEILDHIYFRTEPMEHGIRNEPLDFSSIQAEPILNIPAHLRARLQGRLNLYAGNFRKSLQRG